jgi:hypothetical protein
LSVGGVVLLGFFVVGVVGVVPPGAVVVVVGAVTVNVCGTYQVVREGSVSLTHSAATAAARPAFASEGTLKVPCHLPSFRTRICLSYSFNVGAATAT